MSKTHIRFVCASEILSIAVQGLAFEAGFTWNADGSSKEQSPAARTLSLHTESAKKSIFSYATGGSYDNVVNVNTYTDLLKVTAFLSELPKEVKLTLQSLECTVQTNGAIQVGCTLLSADDVTRVLAARGRVYNQASASKFYVCCEGGSMKAIALAQRFFLAVMAQEGFTVPTGSVVTGKLYYYPECYFVDVGNKTVSYTGTSASSQLVANVNCVSTTSVNLSWVSSLVALLGASSTAPAYENVSLSCGKTVCVRANGTIQSARDSITISDATVLALIAARAQLGLK